MNHKKSIDKQVIIFIILNILDSVFTYFSLVENSSFNEINPIYSMLFDMYGLVAGLAIFKTFGFIGLVYIMYVLTINGNLYSPLKIKVLKIINIFYILLVLNNLYWVISKVYIL